MLECGQNYKGSLDTLCRLCKTVDNESHRLNECLKYKTNKQPPTSHANSSPLTPYANFDDIHSCDKNVISPLLTKIEALWNTMTAHGTMRA